MFEKFAKVEYLNYTSASVLTHISQVLLFRVITGFEKREPKKFDKSKHFFASLAGLDLVLFDRDLFIFTVQAQMLILALLHTILLTD